MDIGPGRIVELARRFPPLELARLVRILESRTDGRDTAQIAARETEQ
jgi:hypothetical protein